MGFIQEQGSYTSLFCLFNAAFKRYVISFLAVSTLSPSRYLFFICYAICFASKQDKIDIQDLSK